MWFARTSPPTRRGPATRGSTRRGWTHRDRLRRGAATWSLSLLVREHPLELLDLGAGQVVLLDEVQQRRPGGTAEHAREERAALRPHALVPRDGRLVQVTLAL